MVAAKKPRTGMRLLVLWPWVLSLAFLCLYVLTLAPTVLWGDNAFFQRTAFEGTLQADGGGHWLWLQAARIFVRLPWGDVAYRVNLLSAVAAAGTLLLLCAAARGLGLGVGAVAAAVASLAVAHTFWMHAVRAEVYTLFTLLVAAQLWLWSIWRPRRVWPVLASAALFGMALLGHQLALFLLPAFVTLVWRRRAWLRRCHWGLLLLCFAVGLVPFFAAIDHQVARPASVGLATALRVYFTRSGVDFGPRMFDFSLQGLPRDAAMGLGLLCFQFVGLAAWLGLRGGLAVWRARVPAPWLALAVLYVTTVLFASGYRVNDQFVFYLPSYLVFALFVGRGWQAVGGRFRDSRRRSIAALGILILVATPPIAYAALTRIMVAIEANPLDVRELPGREPNAYFLWPAKRGYWGTAIYGQTALTSLPTGSFLIADHTPLETFRYYQSVEGLGPDVHLIAIEPGDDLAPIVAGLPAGSDIFLADDDPRYCNLRNLPDAELRPFAGVYRLLVPR
jgi:hypothetical protein